MSTSSHSPQAASTATVEGRFSAQQRSDFDLQTRTETTSARRSRGRRDSTNSLDPADRTGSIAALVATVADLAALYRQIMEDTTMRRISRRLFMVVLSLALATTTPVATIAAPAQATTIANQTGQQKALYQSELEQNLLLRTQLGYGFIAEYGPLRMPPA
jgi:hypothetical protein